MTLISFVVPVHQVQGYLRECLDSILDQSFGDFEVIAVNDCSPDSCGEILAEYAARDSRLRIVTLEDNVGQGMARNLGLSLASGEYVWFVDSDDWLAEDAVRVVAERLRETPLDVLIVGYTRIRWTRSSYVSLPGSRLHDAPPVFTLRECPQAIGILTVPWNKIVRREFLLRSGIRFPPGWYEDIPFTYRVLLAADRISTLDRVCVYYRQRRIGSALLTTGAGHFAIFTNWAQVFDTFDESRPGAAGLRPLLFRRMISHLLMVCGNDSRTPEELRGRFFAEMVALYRRYLPPEGYPMPAGMEGVKHRLVRWNAFRTMEALRTGYRLGKVVRRRGRVVARRSVRFARQRARTARNAFHWLYYKLQTRRRLDESLVLYAAYWYRGYACNPAAIYTKARTLAPHLRGVWVVRRDRVGTLPAGVDHVVAGSLPYFRALARAKYLVNNVNWPNFMIKRPGSVHLMTHHGTPLKVMGLDERAYPAGAPDKGIVRQMRRADRWDFSVSANAFTTQMWERAYPCRYETLETGYPRNDRLVTADARDVARARAGVGARPGERVVLYTPTHRAHHPGYHPPFDPARFVEALGPGGRLLIRSHYFHDRAYPPGAPQVPDRVRDVSAHPSVEELYLAADVLVTDYSSAMFDYAVLDRPIVVYAPDWQAYRMMRGVYFDITAEPPGAIASTFADLLDLFRTGAFDDDAAAKARGDFRRRFCSLEDGRAAERVVRRVLLGESPGTGG